MFIFILLECQSFFNCDTRMGENKILIIKFCHTTSYVRQGYCDLLICFWHYLLSLLPRAQNCNRINVTKTLNLATKNSSLVATLWTQLLTVLSISCEKQNKQRKQAKNFGIQALVQIFPTKICSNWSHRNPTSSLHWEEEV